MSAAEPREDRIARLLADRFELLQFLGKGGFAAVYQVRNVQLRRIEALKVLNDGNTEDPEFARRFLQEARVAAGLDHPHIVKIYDFGQTAEVCWFTMQYIAGPTLVRELKLRGILEQRRTAEIAVAILDALEYSHERGVIHRDIKPENIILDGEGRPYLMDFGIAKSEESLVQTRTGMILGSPAYIAPEQLTGSPVDGRADLYSLGVTLYRMLSNSFPFIDDDAFRMAMKRFTMPPQPLGPKRPGLHPDLEKIVLRALEKEPTDRFANAGEMRDALRKFLAGERVEIPSRPAVPIETLDSASPPLLSSGALPKGISVSGSLPTIRTDRPVAASALSRPPKRRGLWVGTAAGVVVAAVAVILIVRPFSPTKSVSRNPDSTASRATSSRFGPTPVADIPTPEAKSPALAPTASLPVSVGRSSAPPISSGKRDSSDVAPASTNRVPPAAPTPRRAVNVPVQLNEVPVEVSAEIARQFGDRSVGVSIIVGEDGLVTSAKVISRVCPECDEAARAAAMKYRFKPATDVAGRPVESRFVLAVFIPTLAE